MKTTTGGGYTEAHGKLSGMKYHQFLHWQHWLEITGTDPRGVAGIEVRADGLCFWSKAAEAAAQSHFSAVRHNWACLGVS